MSTPHTYAEWIDCLDQLKTGTKDEEIISNMERGKVEWTKGVAERLTQHLYETFEIRLKQSADQLQKELNACYGDETLLVKSILSARKRLAILKKVTELPSFPDHVNSVMLNILKEYAKNTQQSLEDSTYTDRTGRLRSLIRNNPITQFDQIENVFGTSISTIDNANSIQQKSSRRRVILP